MNKSDQQSISLLAEKVLSEQKSHEDYVSRGTELTDPEGSYGDDAEFEKLLAAAREEHGDKFAEDLADIWVRHWPRTYGASNKEAPYRSDRLGPRWKKPARITKSGKMNMQDIAARKGDLKSKFSK